MSSRRAGPSERDRGLGQVIRLLPRRRVVPHHDVLALALALTAALAAAVAISA